MRKRFPTGSVLVHMANHGLPAVGTNKKFSAKSYGDTKLANGDLIQITITLRREGYQPDMVDIARFAEEWEVVKVTESEPPYKEFLTYFERLY